MLADDRGGLNLAGLPVVCEYLGIADVDRLLCQFEVVKSWRHQRAQKKD